MARRLWRQGLNARLSVADSVGCAWAVARFGDIAIVPKGEGAAALDPLPLAALRVDDEIVGALAQSGLKHIRDVVTRPRAPLAARFGSGFLRRIDQALRARGGIDHPASAHSVVHGRAAFRRADRAGSGCAGHHRKTRARIVGRDGAARRGRAAVASGVVPRRRKSVPFRGQGRRSRCAILLASGGCFPSALRRAATKPIPVSVTTCCGCRRWWSSAWTRCRPGLRATITR